MFDKSKKEDQKPKKKARFITTYEQTIQKTLGFGAIQILVDTETGVNYLNTVGDGYSGITPLLDENGKPIVSLDIGKDE
jgi:hypothetical protein